VTAYQSGNIAEVKTVANAGFGEVFAPGSGDVPAWTEVGKHRVGSYLLQTVPSQVLFLTCGVDVQKNRLIFVVRGWGARATSWLLDCGDFWGPTDEDEVWNALSNIMENNRYGGLPIRLTLIDSGYRPDKPEREPEHKVYEFCRRHQRLCKPAKGAASLSGKPLVVSPIEVTPKGGGAKYSIQLVRVNTDWAKLFLHERIRWPHETSTGRNQSRRVLHLARHDRRLLHVDVLGGAHRQAERASALGSALSREPPLGLRGAGLHRGLPHERAAHPGRCKAPLPAQPKAAPPPAQRRDGDGWLKSDSWLGNTNDWFGR
jgi:hypothetical protein